MFHEFCLLLEHQNVGNAGRVGALALLFFEWIEKQEGYVCLELMEFIGDMKQKGLLTKESSR